MRFQHFANNLGDTGRGQLRKSGEINARNRAELINQAVYRSCVRLFYLINVPWLTIGYHHCLPYFRASK
jgi:hypothetical protein